MSVISFFTGQQRLRRGARERRRFLSHQLAPASDSRRVAAAPTFSTTVCIYYIPGTCLSWSVIYSYVHPVTPYLPPGCGAALVGRVVGPPPPSAPPGGTGHCGATNTYCTRPSDALRQDDACRRIRAGGIKCRPRRARNPPSGAVITLYPRVTRPTPQPRTMAFLTKKKTCPPVVCSFSHSSKGHCIQTGIEQTAHKLP